MVCTRNSERTIRACLNSIRESVPLCHLILVDHYSDDHTLQIAEDFNPVIIKENRALSYARRLGIATVDTSVFAFVDSDVVLGANWFNSIIEFLNADVGAVETIIWPEEDTAFCRRARVEFHTRPKDLKMSDHATLCATIIRTGLVSDWKPPDVFRYEDHLLQRHILAKRYRWLIAPVVATHLNFNDETLYRHVTLDAAYYRLLFPRSRWFNRGLKVLIANIIEGFWASVKASDWSLLMVSIKIGLCWIEGLRNYQKYLEPQ